MRLGRLNWLIWIQVWLRWFWVIDINVHVRLSVMWLGICFLIIEFLKAILTKVVAENLQQRRYCIAFLFNHPQIFLKFAHARDINKVSVISVRRYMQRRALW